MHFTDISVSDDDAGDALYQEPDVLRPDTPAALLRKGDPFFLSTAMRSSFQLPHNWAICEHCQLAGPLGHEEVHRSHECPSVMKQQLQRREPPLLKAARFGNMDVLQRLLGSGAKINQCDVHGSTALMLATAEGHQDIAWALLKAGAGVGSHAAVICRARAAIFVLRKLKVWKKQAGLLRAVTGWRRQVPRNLPSAPRNSTASSAFMNLATKGLMGQRRASSHSPAPHLTHSPPAMACVLLLLAWTRIQTQNLTACTTRVVHTWRTNIVLQEAAEGEVNALKTRIAELEKQLLIW